MSSIDGTNANDFSGWPEKPLSVADRIPLVEPVPERPQASPPPSMQSSVPPDYEFPPGTGPIPSHSSEERVALIELATNRALTRVGLRGTAISMRALEEAHITLNQIAILVKGEAYTAKTLRAIRGVNAAWMDKISAWSTVTMADGAQLFSDTNRLYFRILDLAELGSPEFAKAVEDAGKHFPAYGALDKLLGEALDALVRAGNQVPTTPTYPERRA